MESRIHQLEEWNIPHTLARLAKGELPHQAFRVMCEPIRSKRSEEIAVGPLDKSYARDETEGVESVALWERNHHDGHSFDIVYCGRTEAGFIVWNVEYADDMPGPTSTVIGVSEQGVLFWLFFFLIPSEFARYGERAYNTLAEAAKSVDFKHLVEVFRLEEEIGADFSRRNELSEASRRIQ